MSKCSTCYHSKVPICHAWLDNSYSFAMHDWLWGTHRYLMGALGGPAGALCCLVGEILQTSNSNTDCPQTLPGNQRILQVWRLVDLMEGSGKCIFENVNICVSSEISLEWGKCVTLCGCTHTKGEYYRYTICIWSVEHFAFVIMINLSHATIFDQDRNHDAYHQISGNEVFCLTNYFS